MWTVGALPAPKCADGTVAYTPCGPSPPFTGTSLDDRGGVRRTTGPRDYGGTDTGSRSRTCSVVITGPSDGCDWSGPILGPRV